MSKILNFTQHPATPEQLAAGVINLMHHDQAALKSMLNVPEQSVYKMIEVLFCESVLDVWLEIFNHDDQATFEILHAAKDGVDILHIIEALGGLSKLSKVVEQKLKEENCDD